MPDNLTQEENNRLMTLVGNKLLSYNDMIKRTSEPDRKVVFPFPFAITVGEDKDFVVNAMAFVSVDGRSIPIFAKIVDEDNVIFYPSKKLTAALESEVAEEEKAKAEAQVAPESSEAS